MLIFIFFILFLEGIYKGALDDFSFLVFAIFMAVGFYFGWNINRVIARFYFKWSLDKVNRVFSMSEVPMEWYQKNGFREYKSKIEEGGIQTKAEHKSIQHLALRTGLIFYFGISFLVVVSNPYIEGRAITQWRFFLWPAPLYAIAMGIIALILLKYSDVKSIKDKEYFSNSLYFNQNDVFKVTKPDAINNILAKGQLTLGVLFCLFIASIGVFMANYAVTDNTFDTPSKHELINVSGILDDTKEKEKEKENHITFKLERDKNSVYAYLKRAGSYDYVLNILKASKGKNIIVSFNRSDANHSEHNKVVYELIIEKEDVRLYEQSKRSILIWQIISIVISLMFLSFGVLGIWGAWIEFKKSK